MITQQLRGPTALQLAVSLAPAAQAQKLIHTFFGNINQLNLGNEVAGAGDVNNDGFDDVMSGTPGEGQTGGVRVWSGFDGSLLYYKVGISGEDLGHSVAGVGDVNNDGFDDFAAGTIAGGANAGGRVLVWSGLNGNVIHDLSSATSGDRFGISLAGLGDINGDNRDDFAIGADRGGPLITGEVTIHSGLDGSIMRTFVGDGTQDSFGDAINAAGDVDGDGFTDLVIGARRDDDNGPSCGSARVVSPRTGAVFYTVYGDAAGHEFGDNLDGAGDVDGDGNDDVIVGTQDAGYARIFTGTTGAVYATLTGSVTTRYGSAVAGVGDANGDGRDDVVVGEFNTNTGGQVNLISGLDLSNLFTTFSAYQGGRYGEQVANAGDVNNDGLTDWIVGAIGVDFAAPNGGMAEVIGGARVIGTNYCGPAVANSTGQPGRITAYGSTVLSDDCLTLIVEDIPAGQFGFFLASQSQGGFQPPNSMGFICITGNIGRFNNIEEIIVGPIGELNVDLGAIPVNPTAPVQVGQTWNFQCWYRDQNPFGPSNFTDGVSITFN